MGRAPPGPVLTGPNPSMTDASVPLAEAPFPYYTHISTSFYPILLRIMLNPKIAECPHRHSTALCGTLTRFARHFCRAERRDSPSRALSGTSLRSANFGLRQSGRYEPVERHLSRKYVPFAKLPHGHPPWKGLQSTFLMSSVYGWLKSRVR